MTTRKLWPEVVLWECRPQRCGAESDRNYRTGPVCTCWRSLTKASTQASVRWGTGSQCSLSGGQEEQRYGRDSVLSMN